LGIERGAAEAVIHVLDMLVMQLIDMNTNMGELHHRFVVQGTYLQGIVDELRTLNSSMGRMEDLAIYPPK
jgi:hypothetical protein